MGYKATVDLLILKELQRRAQELSRTYDPDLPSVVLVPGGMGSRLVKAETGNPEHELTSLLVRTMALLCVRHSVIEDIHAGVVPVTRTGDYSDVTVINADGRRIPWLEVSHFDDNAMREFMRQVVDRVYTFEVRAKDPDFLERIELWAQVASRLDEPKLNPSFLPALTGSRTLP